MTKKVKDHKRLSSAPVSNERKKVQSWNSILEWSEMVKIEHTVFALPFALSGLILARPALPHFMTLLWTILAFAGARAAAMTLNRIIDCKIDSLNPRTMNRAIPAGKICRKHAFWFALCSFAIMLFAASQLPPMCLILSPIAIFWLTFYSYTKRFTWMCHLVLGIALGGAALAGWIASGGSLADKGAWILAFAVTTWVAGFDIIYACQDFEFDCRKNIFSIPSRFGIKNALHMSALLHLLTVASFVLLGYTLNLGLIYWLGTAAISILLAWQHKLVSANDLSRVDAAFFSINGYLSIAAFVAILLDKIFYIKI